MPKPLEKLDFDFEIKALTETKDDDYFRFEGLASTFLNIDHGRDIVLPGAFTESLKEITPVILWQHSSYEPIGMPEECREVPEGLYLRGMLPKSDTFVSGRVIPQLKIKSITKMSIGYRAIEWKIDSANDVRILEKVKLREVSLVTFPMNDKADITGFKSALSFVEGLDVSPEIKEKITRFISEQKRICVEDLSFLNVKGYETKRDLENVLRESGLFSNQAATKLASVFSRESLEGDADDAVKAEIKQLLTDYSNVELELQVKSILKSLES